MNASDVDVFTCNPIFYTNFEIKIGKIQVGRRLEAFIAKWSKLN